MTEKKGNNPTVTFDASDRRSSGEKGSEDLAKMRNDKQDSGGGIMNYGEHISSQARGDNAEREPGTVTPHKSTITGK